MNTEIPIKNKIETSKTATSPNEQKTILAASIFEGPLPHPEILKHYDSIVPGAALRILEMAEKQLNHRIELENRQLEFDMTGLRGEYEIENKKLSLVKRGQTIGFIIAGSAIFLSSVFIFLGKTITGSILGGATIGSIIIAAFSGHFIKSKKK